jgi:hypothetical protein
MRRRRRRRRKAMHLLLVDLLEVRLAGRLLDDLVY